MIMEYPSRDRDLRLDRLLGVSNERLRNADCEKLFDCRCSEVVSGYYLLRRVLSPWEN